MPFSLRQWLAPAPKKLQRDLLEVVLEDGRVLSVQRVRDPRARRLKLSVDERGARLTLPLRASLVSGDRFLDEHRQWLATQLDRHSTDPALLPRLQAGITSSLPLRGRQLALEWHPGRFLRMERQGELIVFQHPQRASEAGLRRTLRGFYEAEARADIGRWLPAYLPGLPCAPRQVRLKVMSSQWGSLAPDGSMALDLALVLGRSSAFEYVLVHELCHLLQPNHSAAFWHEVEQRFPQWRAERDYFHGHGRQLKASLRALLSA
jgi:predicted metal-dependent hydrolase